MTISFFDAHALAVKYLLENIPPPVNDSYTIIDSEVKEGDSGWYFPFQSARFVETQDFEFSLVGNWPILVSKSGEVMGPTRPKEALTKIELRQNPRDTKSTG